MGPLAYLHLQMRLEGKECIDGRLLRQVGDVPDEEMPWILIAQPANSGWVIYFDEAMAADLQEKLSACVSTIKFPAIDPLLTILTSHHVRFEVGHYKTYVFSSPPANDTEVVCLSTYDPRVQAFGFDGFAEHVYAVMQNNVLVSACVSTRENESCGEAWVYTSPEYRHQGFAQSVVNTWARSLLEHGKVPFYSHRIENAASANLARKLGLQPVFEEIAITQISSQ